MSSVAISIASGPRASPRSLQVTEPVEAATICHSPHIALQELNAAIENGDLQLVRELCKRGVMIPMNAGDTLSNCEERSKYSYYSSSASASYGCKELASTSNIYRRYLQEVPLAPHLF